MLGKNSQMFFDASIIETEIEANGYKGGDSKKGGFVKLLLRNVAATDWNTTVVHDFNVSKFENPQVIEIVFKGDSEIRNFHKIINLWKEYLEYQLGEIDENE